MAAGLLDRLRLWTPSGSPGSPPSWRCSPATPEPPRCSAPVRTLETGERVFERRIPVGVIGAVFEARPNVTVDVASQVLKARSAAVLRTGSAALGSATALVEQVLRPGTGATHGAPRGRRAARPAARARRRRRPRRVARPGAAGRRPRFRGRHPQAVRARRDRGHPGARPRRRRRRPLPATAAPTEDDVTRLVTDSTDRLGVCNRLNLLLVDRPVYDTPAAGREEAARRPRHRALSLAPHDHPLGHEWALDSGAEAHVTVAVVDGPRRRRATPPPGRPPAWPRRSAPPTSRSHTAFIDALHRHRGVLERARRACSTATSCWACPRPASTSITPPGPARPGDLPSTSGCASS
jgi:glutamate-5-semialdehyde dehydrogenase